MISLLVVLAVGAPDWSKSFSEPDVIADAISARSGLMIVMGNARADGASAALVTELTDAVDYPVMTGDTLGKTQGLGDRAIVKRAAELEVDRIAIIRVTKTRKSRVATIVVYNSSAVSG
ncbi:MAG: hypothetical protein AAF658_02040 [Myxococcota bacterium]